jgi:hypothetical protein
MSNSVHSTINFHGWKITECRVPHRELTLESSDTYLKLSFIKPGIVDVSEVIEDDELFQQIEMGNLFAYLRSFDARLNIIEIETELLDV